MDLSFENGVQIPSEIMVNILSRCGTNDLLAFKLVSKNWFFTIKNPNFVRIHTDFGHDRLKSSFLLGSRFVSAEEAYDRLITISSNADSEELLNVLRLHLLMDQNISMDLLGTYNGRVKFDFGFNDLSSSMYILVIYEDSNNGNQLRVMLYSCLTHTWTNINPPDFHTNIWESKSVCINGIIYWISYPPIEAVEQLPTILHFNFADHIFSTISGPSNRPVFSYVPVEFQGSLAIICGELQGTEIVRYITMQLMYDAKSQQYWWPVLSWPYVNVNTRLVVSYRKSTGKLFISMDSVNLTGKTKQPLTPSLKTPSTKRSRGHEAENEANNYVTPDIVKFSRRSALSDLTNVSQTQPMSLPHNSLFVPNHFYPGYQTHMPPHIGFTPLVFSHEYVDIGLPTYECEHCGAIFGTRTHQQVKKSKNPKFSLCCLHGKVQLPKIRDSPKILENLLVNNDSRSKQFRRRIRTYNNMFSFTSMGGRIDNSTNDGTGPYVFRLHGQNMHLIGDLLPKADETPRFSQLYIYDTDNEVVNRISSAFEDQCDASIVMQLSQMLDSINPLVKVFRSVKDHPSLSSRDSLRLKLIKKHTTDARIYNLPTANEITALIVGDFDPENVERDIIVEERSRTLQRIDELHPLYLPMQYPLMFPRGEDGYRQDVLFRCGKLTQQFIVDGYTMIESQRLLYIRLHQKELRADSYVTLTHALSRGETISSNIGKRIVLPSSFTGSERYSRENFQDAMTISQDRPDLLSRVFKIKLNALMKNITKEFLFGTCRAEIPDQDSNPRLYEAVKSFMIHGPCGLDRKNSPCMVKSRCSKHFPKKFTDRTSFDEDGYCKYRRRDSGHFIEKSGIKLDSRRIFGFDINFCEPSVERLPFHLPDQQGVVFPDNAPIDAVVFNATVKQTKFLAWLKLTINIPRLDLHLDDDRVQEIALAEIENFLKINGRSLADFLPMPIPNEAVMQNIGNLLISEELNYDRNALRTEHAHLLSSLTNEQRSKGEIVLAVASSGIASQLIPGGRTAHSRFAIPLNIDGNSTCHIVQGSDLVELMVHTKLIIWDEAPMAHRHCFEALDRTLRDIMHSQNAALAKHPFGGKVVVLGGDFRQILPVIPRAGREDIVLASLNSSYLWPSCKVLSLTKNMRLSQGNSVEENSSISRFAEWILKVGEGNIGKIMNDEEHEITIDDDILIDDAEDLIQAIVESTYPKLVDNYKNYVYFSEMAILSPTLDDVCSSEHI
ncbi:putative PIF1 DNA helicase/replication protein A1-like protein [Senna tora]|uniref:ATP-dependent DNA helicase n=1 Tax=Senna tora TaxID=362788 RepID=A0A834SNZ1_9FABA|nr:putative PIF1 DNA helicase/replication protein A1-like protein [Senna tora]